MWTVIKFDNKKINLLQKDLREKIDNRFKIYIPKIGIINNKKNKIIKKEINLLGDYLFCFSEKFQNKYILNKLNYLKGSKYFLGGTKDCQKNINNFIENCKNSEDNNGYVTCDLFKLEKNCNYQFSSGILDKFIFELLDYNKNKLKILIGNLKTTINKKKYLFKPI
tara:strand:+ start:278 stop:775 length:498 start_codon:yes stop_codon:yes gene_type:complete